MATIQLNDLAKSFDGHRYVVDRINLTIEDGEFISLLGPSGCGKTTTLRCIAGLEMPTSGEILQDGTPLAAPASRLFVPPEKRQMGMVFQSYALWPHMTAAGNIAYPLRRNSRLPSSKINQRVRDMLDLVGLADCGDRLPSKLSGGQQQRVALARALVNEPRVVLFDEPLSNLDAGLRTQMRRQIRALHDRVKTTTVYVTHDQVEALALSDRIVVMNKGVIQQIGTPREIYTAPANRFVADFIGFDNVVPATVTGSSAAGLTIRLGAAGPQLRTAIPAEHANGAQLDVAVRASSFRLLPNRPDGSNGFDAVVERTTYLGEEVEFRLRAEDVGVVVRAADAQSRAAYGGTLPEVGDSVHVQVGEEKILRIAP
ncbi:ABC transporter ATP-binding protein [Phytohabitans flavus]|uniref:Spermidine/putrescine ABC transporter ATP-binding protein n=1 Tax=Phytohabitans flavus TaxID=1076124 RepID=A0A6F8XVY2_9ACTN|nr:ABC transporter ATP-binding protein [Phytohabitans flavus]BCB77898.1 spermidine/putrescine ABC transporter ATP-binding protein [Phytohabitans flavus]